MDGLNHLPSDFQNIFPVLSFCFSVSGLNIEVISTLEDAPLGSTYVQN